VAGVGRALQEGRRIYWVCPLIDESETVDLAAAEDRFQSLQEHFGALVGLVHGRLKSAEKDRAMDSFARGDPALGRHNVIEVGVDVPEATVMVIEHAERFGLAQLHQLRGRIGRGSSLILPAALPRALGETAKARLASCARPRTGSACRGRLEAARRRRCARDPASGMPGFRVAHIETHGKLFAGRARRRRARAGRDPALTGARGEALRTLLYLFERDERSG